MNEKPLIKATSESQEYFLYFLKVKIKGNYVRTAAIHEKAWKGINNLQLPLQKKQKCKNYVAALYPTEQSKEVEISHHLYVRKMVFKASCVIKSLPAKLWNMCLKHFDWNKAYKRW